MYLLVYNRLIAQNQAVQQGSNPGNATGLREFLNQLNNSGGAQNPPSPMKNLSLKSGSNGQTGSPLPSAGNKMVDSTGLNFDFKDKIKDSSYQPVSGGNVSNPPTMQSVYGQNVAPATAVSKYGPAPLEENKKAFNPGNSLNHTGLEFGSENSEKISHILQQNRQLKDLVITKENQISQILAENQKMQKELQNIMDPLSKNSQLKSKYKETISEKDQKIDGLERENFNLRKDLRELTATMKATQSRLDGIEAKHHQEKYDLRLELESKGRKQMVISKIYKIGIVRSRAFDNLFE